MTERLAQLFADTAEDVRAPQLAETAWVQAGQVRRRRRAVVTAAAAVVAATVGVGVTLAPSGRGPAPDHTGTPTGAPSMTPVVHQLPATLEADHSGPLPAHLPFPPTTSFASFVPSAARVVALYQLTAPDSATAPEPVYVWAGSVWTRLDGLTLVFTRDEAGNQANPLRSTSLSPDGRYAAFPQPDKVVVVDLTAGSSFGISAPGFNEHVIWLERTSVLVGGDQRTYTVDIERRTAAQNELPPLWDVVANVDAPGEVLRLDPSDRGDLDPFGGNRPPLTLSRPGTSSTRTIDDKQLPPYGLLQWYGRGWQHRNLVVRAAYGHTARESGIQLLAVIDTGTGTVVRLLVFPIDRWKNCCEPVGWLGTQTVVFRNDPGGLAAWNIHTGTVRKLTDSTLYGVIAIAGQS